MSSGPSEPIFTFLFQFEFYPTKQSRFEKISPPMFLEFHLVFSHNFPDFFFEIFEFQFKKSAIFLTLVVSHSRPRHVRFLSPSRPLWFQQQAAASSL
jgi:hypothetical protein